MYRLLALTGLVIPSLLTAQGVAVAPHALHIDHRTRSGAIELYNPGNDPVEVEISTIFGFPTTDSAGIIRVAYHEDDSDHPSAAAWIRAFPRRVRIPGQTRQTIRLLAQPPADLPDGEYWSRLSVAAEAGQVPVEGVADTSVKISLALRVRTIVAVNYRNGTVHTAARLNDLQASVIGDSLAFRVDIEREGNAAFLGTLSTVLLDAEGAEVKREDIQIAVYYDLSPRRALSLENVPPGTYTLVSRLTTERADLDAEVVLQAEPVADTLRVEIP